MGGSGAPSPGRAIALGVVIAAHAGVLLILSIELDRRARPAPAAPVGTLILLSVPLSTRASPDQRPNGKVEEITPIEPLLPAPIAPPDVQLPGEVQAPIDWLAEADRAAEGVTLAPHTRSFGKMPQAPDWLGSSQSAPMHHAGDQYRLETGEWIVWVSDRCYIISEPAPLGIPDVFARSRGTQMACQAPRGPPPGELFKDLPAYRK
jgi:hypothetical protein